MTELPSPTEMGGDLAAPKRPGQGGPGRYFEAGEYEVEVALRDDVEGGAGGGEGQQEGHGGHGADGGGQADGADERRAGPRPRPRPRTRTGQPLSSPPSPPAAALERSKSAGAGPVAALSAPPPAASASATAVVVTETPVPTFPVRKTVYLIRHAESDENRRQRSLGRSLGSVRRLALPTREDLAASLELVDVQAQIDSDVSAVGEAQIAQVGGRLRADGFVEAAGISLVVHSPLRRARQTSAGMLGCVAPRSDEGGRRTGTEAEAGDGGAGGATPPSDGASNLPQALRLGAAVVGNVPNPLASLGIIAPGTPDPTAAGERHEFVSRVVELQDLSERTPLEWLPINHDKFTDRIAAFEKWLAAQPESVIAVVGHSHYFMSMLGLDFKFGNCDVWRLTYDASVGSWTSPEEVKREVREEYWRQKDSLTREKGGQIIRVMEKRTEEMRRELEAKTDKVRKDLEAQTDKVRKDLEAQTDKVRKDLEAQTDKMRKDLEAQKEKLRKDWLIGRLIMPKPPTEDANEHDAKEMALQEDEKGKKGPIIERRNGEDNGSGDGSDSAIDKGKDDTWEAFPEDATWAGNSEEEGTQKTKNQAHCMEKKELCRGWSGLFNLYRYYPEQDISSGDGRVEKEGSDKEF